MCEKEDNINVVLSGGASIVDTRIVFGKDSKTIICGCGHSVKVFGVSSGECLHKLRGHTDRVTCVILNPCNPFQILTSSLDKTIIKWDYQDGVKLKVFHCNVPFVSLHICSLQSPGLVALAQRSEKAFDVVAFRLPHSQKADNKLDGTVISSRVIGKENTVSVGCSGEVVGAVSVEYLMVTSLFTKKSQKHSLDEESSGRAGIKFRCVACHPTDRCLATGLSNGRILLWYKFLKKNPIITVLHWHALPVLDLCFTAEGSYLLSTGYECVLVKWQVNSQHKDTLPRLGSPMIGVSCSQDGTLYATSHSDNSIQIISSTFKIVQHFQGLSMGHLDHQVKQPVQAGLNLDPRTGALVTNGTTGHLQFYSIQNDKQLFNLDIVGHNYISPENLKNPLVMTEVENAAFDSAGNWLATVERRDDNETAVDMKLKFWSYNEENQRFTLNTVVDMPHNAEVHTLRFRGSSHMAVTTSPDGKFKLWSLRDDTDIYRSNFCWQCESVGFYRDFPAGPGAFSQDGSLLAVGFGPTLTLWDPDTNAFRHAFTVEGQIRHLEFGTGTSMCYLMFTTESQLMCWNLLSCAVEWMVPLNATVLIKSPSSEHIAVFTDFKQLCIYTPKMSFPVYQRSRVSKSEVISAIFVPNKDNANNYHNDSQLSWQNKARLYFFNAEQELLTLTEQQEEEQESKLSTMLTQKLPETPFSMLMSKKNRPGLQANSHSYAQQKTGQPGSEFLKDMLSTPAHVQPPVSSLCHSFLQTLLIQRKNSSSHMKSTEDESDDDDDENENKMDQSALSSDSDMDTEHAQQEMDVSSDHDKTVTRKNVDSAEKDVQDLNRDDQRSLEYDNIKSKHFKRFKELV